MNNRDAYQLKKLMRRLNRQRLPSAMRTGDGYGTNSLPGHADLAYVRPATHDIPLVVYAGDTPDQEGLHVLVGVDPNDPGVTRILQLARNGGGLAEIAAVLAHAPSHFLNGTDPLWVDLGQVVNLLATPSGLNVTVKAGWVIVAGKPVWVEKQTVTLTPPATGALYALIRADADGVLSVQDGTPVDEFVDLVKTDIPAVAAGYAALWAVRLYEDQTVINWTTAAPDLVDLRFATNAGMAVAEEDGDPSGHFKIIKFPNGSLTDNADGTVSVDLSAAAGDSTFTGLTADLPAPSQAGDQYFPSDGFVHYRDTGAAWVPWGPIFPLTAPPTSGWTWDNQQSATVVTANGGIILKSPAYSATGIIAYYRTAPTPPYTIAAFIIPLLLRANSAGFGIFFRESSTGKICTLRFAHSTNFGFYSDKWTNSTTYSAAYISGFNAGTEARLVFMRIQDDNSNRICSFSPDGINFYAFHTVGRTDFLTADQVGIFVSPINASYGVTLNLLSWKES